MYHIEIVVQLDSRHPQIFTLRKQGIPKKNMKSVLVSFRGRVQVYHNLTDMKCVVLLFPLTISSPGLQGVTQRGFQNELMLEMNFTLVQA